MSKLLNRKFVLANRVIIQEGDTAHKAFFIESGRVEIYRVGSDGNEQSIGTVGEGEIVGELAFFSNKNERIANVRTIEDTTFVALTQRDIQQFIDTMDKPARAFFKLLMNRLKRANDQLIQNFTSPQHLSEAARITAENIRNTSLDAESEDRFDTSVTPLLKVLLEALREFEKTENAKRGLD